MRCDLAALSDSVTSLGRLTYTNRLSAYVRELAESGTGQGDPLTRLFDYYLGTADRADRFIAPHRYRVPLDISEAAAAAPAINDYQQALEWLSAEQGNLLDICRIT